MPLYDTRAFLMIQLTVMVSPEQSREQEPERRYRVAVVGATGVVGREMVNQLEERDFPAGEVTLFASARSAGTQVPFRGEGLTVQELTLENYRGFSLALFSAGAETALEWGPRFAADGCWVIDNSSAFRMDPNVPLVVPEVNAHEIDRLVGRAS